MSLFVQNKNILQISYALLWLIRTTFIVMYLQWDWVQVLKLLQPYPILVIDIENFHMQINVIHVYMIIKIQNNFTIR